MYHELSWLFVQDIFVNNYNVHAEDSKKVDKDSDIFDNVLI